MEFYCPGSCPRSGCPSSHCPILLCYELNLNSSIETKLKKSYERWQSPRKLQIPQKCLICILLYWFNLIPYVMSENRESRICKSVMNNDFPNVSWVTSSQIITLLSRIGFCPILPLYIWITEENNGLRKWQFEAFIVQWPDYPSNHEIESISFFLNWMSYIYL